MSMDAVKFINERQRMCKTHDACENCPLHKMHIGLCYKWCFDHPEETVAAVEKWAEEHPRKTRQSVFLKMFPNAILNDKGQPGYCPRMLDTTYNPAGNCVLDVDICQRCMDKFWGQEVE